MSTNAIRNFCCKTLSDEDIKNRIGNLLKLVLEHDQLKAFRTEDPYLLRFLHCSDFDVTLALEKMEKYTNLIFVHPECFGSKSPLYMKKQIEVNDKAILKDRDRKGRAILIAKLGKMDFTNSCLKEQVRIFEIWAEAIMDDPITQANGLSVIVDMSGYSWKLFTWGTPANIKAAAKKADVYPLKDILIHIVNTSFLLSATIKLVEPFLNNRLKNMFKFHLNDWSSLHEYISTDVLPPEYGGKGPDIDFDKSVQMLFEQDSSIAAKLIYHDVSNK